MQGACAGRGALPRCFSDFRTYSELVVVWGNATSAAAPSASSVLHVVTYFSFPSRHHLGTGPRANQRSRFTALGLSHRPRRASKVVVRLIAASNSSPSRKSSFNSRAVHTDPFRQKRSPRLRLACHRKCRHLRLAGLQRLPLTRRRLTETIETTSGSSGIVFKRPQRPGLTWERIEPRR